MARAGRQGGCCLGMAAVRDEQAAGSGQGVGAVAGRNYANLSAGRLNRADAWSGMPAVATAGRDSDGRQKGIYRNKIFRVLLY